jgi:hypothetical protein
VAIGLIALVVLTTWAVATVSVWWVPAYLALMVLIFVTPGGRHPTTTASERSGESTRVGESDLSRRLRLDRADGLEHHHPVIGPIAGPTAEAVTDPQDSSAGSPDARIPKIRRAQGRARRAAKTAERAPESPPVTWIQVGPGKFVRVEGGIPAALTPDAQETTVGASLETDTPVPAPPVIAADAGAVGVQGPPESPVAAPGDVAIVFVSEGPRAGTGIEEYGIAPSAFNPATMATSAVEHVNDAVPGVAVGSGSIANRGALTSRHRVDPGHVGLQRPSSKERVALVSRGIVAAIPCVARARSRLDVPAGWIRRSSMRSESARNARLRQAVCCAFGQLAHCERTWLPRSPPFGHRFCGRPALPVRACRDFARGGARPAEPAQR